MLTLNLDVVWDSALVEVEEMEIVMEVEMEVEMEMEI